MAHHPISPSSSSTAVNDDTEQTPLLRPPTSLAGSSPKSKAKLLSPDINDDTVEVTVQEGDTDHDELRDGLVALTEAEQRRRLQWKIAKYVFWTVVGAVIVGVFVKGFIESGDVDVSVVRLSLKLVVPMMF